MVQQRWKFSDKKLEKSLMSLLPTGLNEIQQTASPLKALRGVFLLLIGISVLNNVS